jgi:hypothetical protein
MSVWDHAQHGGGLWGLVDELPMVRERAFDIELLLASPRNSLTGVVPRMLIVRTKGPLSFTSHGLALMSSSAVNQPQPKRSGLPFCPSAHGCGSSSRRDRPTSVFSLASAAQWGDGVTWRHS